MCDENIIVDMDALIAKRKRWVDANYENEFNVDKIISGMYDDPSHFVYELLQNSEDAKAVNVSFELFDDRLEYTHDGVDFTFENVKSITGIGNSTKEDDLTQIGKFGVGFKSVFAITSSPEIYCNAFNFRIKDFVLPEIIPVNNVLKGTKFIFKFNHKIRTQNEIYDLIYNRLCNINIRTILFLNNIKSISWKISGKVEGTVNKNVSSASDKYNIVFITDSCNKTNEKWLLFTKKINIKENSHKIEVAYKIEFDEKSQKEFITSINDSKLVVFFPTNLETHLKFLIQGPYRTTPARDNIPQSDEINEKLIYETAVLIAESISNIKELGFLTYEFLCMLPISEREFIQGSRFRAMYEKVYEKLKSDEKLFPTVDNKYIDYKNAYICKDKDILKIIDDKNLALLTNNIEAKWLDDRCTKNYEFYYYIRDKIGINEIDKIIFAEKFTEKFIINQSDQWIIMFYDFLTKNPDLWQQKSINYAYDGVFRKKPIIRLEKQENKFLHVNPFDDKGNPNAYIFNGSQSNYNIVKVDITNNELARKFLVNLGIKIPDEVDEIIEFVIPKYFDSANMPNSKDNIEDIKRVFSVLRKDIQGKSKLISKLKEINIFRSLNYSQQIEKYTSAKNIYLTEKYTKNNNLEKFFEGNTKVHFISSDYDLIFCECNDNDNFLDLLLKLGFKKSPIEKVILGSEPKIDGLDDLKLNIDAHKSSILWDFLIESLRNNINVFEVTTPQKINGESSVCKILKSIEWLPNKYDDKFYKPMHIMVSDLPESFDVFSNQAKIIIRFLLFKHDDTNKAIEQITDTETRQKFKLALELSLNELQELIEKKKQIKIKEIELQEKEKSINNKTLSIDIKTKELDLREKEIEKQSKEISQRQINLTAEENRINGDFKEVWKPKNGIASIIVKEAAEEIEALERTAPFTDQYGYTNPSEEVAYVGSKKLKRTHPDTFKNIGEFGELTVLKYLKDDYYKKKYPKGTWDDLSYESKEYKLSQSGKVVVILNWVNSQNFNAIGRDIQAFENGETIYFEVKTGFWIMPSEAQWSLACKMKENYYICKVYNVGEKVSQVRIIQNPYEYLKNLLMNPYDFWDKNIYNKILPKVCI